MRGLAHLITTAASLQGILAGGSSSSSSSSSGGGGGITSPAMNWGDVPRSLTEATVSRDDHPKGGGFLASANLFGEPRQFLEDDSSTNDGAVKPKQVPDNNNNNNVAETTTETEGTTITIIAEEDVGGETGDSSSSTVDLPSDPISTKSNSSSTGIMMGLYDPCPPGFICSRSGQESCESVRQIPISLGMGDIHAGLYCPGRSDRLETGYEICDVGSYCPNSTSRISCPKGYFCPHKTAKPEIKCSSCPEGAITLERASYAYTILVLVVVLMIVVVAAEFLRRYKNERNKKLRKLTDRSVNGLKDVAYKRRHLKKLKMLKPKLKMIEKRLRKDFGSEVRMELVISGETEDGKITFKADKLFDVLDREKVGEVSYTELNRLMKLSPTQFREFVKRMNEAAGEHPETEEVERHVFITQFLPVFDAISHLQATPEEAAHLFDEIAKQGVTSTGEVPHRLFYTSPLADFLTDAQINALVKDFQRTKESHDDEKLEHCDVLQKKPAKQPNQNQKRAPLVYRHSFFGLPQRSDTTSRDEFISRYPSLLVEVTKAGDQDPGLFTSQLILHKGIDVTFQDLAVSVEAKDRPVKIVGKLTGRLKAGTMTAIMGGEGAGKTSLLHALSGKTFNGSVTGKIIVNGHKTSLETHGNVVGFVPEDDAMYNELTVREILIFSGMFQLPEGTPLVEIEDLADLTMANLDLSRVMHKRQGRLSNFQKKRVSIGFELMKKPRIIFVERPTKGLDPTSALLIIRSLKKLADVQGITVCTTLNQTRRDAFELFDSLILLGSSGRLVYHGKVSKVGKYFNELNYYLPTGESVTDWILDISTGRLPPPVRQVRVPKRKKTKSHDSLPRSDGDSRTTGTTAESSLEFMPEKKKVKRVTFAIAERTPSGSDEKENLAGHTTKPFDTAPEQAKATCQLLNDHWKTHVKDLPRKKYSRYVAPEPFPLPKKKEQPPLFNQLACQLLRLLILLERNWLSRLIDTTFICVAVILITLMDDLTQPTKDSTRAGDANYDSITGPGSEEAIIQEFPKLFDFAIQGISGDIEAYAIKVGVLFALLISFVAVKNAAMHRPQFFREAASGYNVTAYFWSQNIGATAVHSFQAVVASLFAFCLRNSLASWYVYVINFLMLSWIAVSWGLLVPLLVPEKYAVRVTAVFVAFFAVFFSGVVTPITFEVIYDNYAAEVASGLLSSTRFFVESMTVTEARCLPIQSGFTGLKGDASESSSFQILHYGLNDFDEVIQRSYDGWFWGALPCLFVGLWIRWMALGLMYISNRARQAKKPFALKDANAKLWFSAYMFVLMGFLAAALVFMLK